MKTCVIYDADEGFGKRLFGGLLRKAQSQFNVLLFTGAEELKRYLADAAPEVLLVSEECMDEWIGHVYHGRVILLTEEAWINEPCEFKGYRCCSIYRYQSLDRLFNEIVIKGELRRSSVLKTKRIIGLYSPVYVEERQSFGLCMAKLMSDKFKTLYLNLEEFSGLVEILPSDNMNTLSDTVYYYQQPSGAKEDRIASTIKHVVGIDYIPPVTCSDDISEMETSIFAGMVEQLGSMFGYEVIVVDVSGAFKQPWRLLDICQTVYMPVKDDYISSNRVASFEKYCIDTGMGYVMDKIEKIRLPKEREGIGPEFWNNITYSEIYSFAKQLLEKDIGIGDG